MSKTSGLSEGKKAVVISIEPESEKGDPKMMEAAINGTHPLIGQEVTIVRNDGAMILTSLPVGVERWFLPCELKAA
jgi:hypothetical protein